MNCETLTAFKQRRKSATVVLVNSKSLIISGDTIEYIKDINPRSPLLQSEQICMCSEAVEGHVVHVWLNQTSCLKWADV